jgi:hypothetical protein
MSKEGLINGRRLRLDNQSIDRDPAARKGHFRSSIHDSKSSASVILLGRSSVMDRHGIFHPAKLDAPMQTTQKDRASRHQILTLRQAQLRR